MTPSPALAASVNIDDLNFDTCERLRHLDWLLTQLRIRENARILDVGGYPCYMARAFPERKIVTVDMYAKGHAPYVKASGAALPFSDNAFEVTVACDVLEHVPSRFRATFLSELSRVSSKAVIVAGPYTTPGTAQAELAVRQFLPDSSPAQMWLSEHAECGLPSLTETVEQLAGKNTEVRVLPVGTLTEWMLFFAAQAAGERDHRIATAVGNFISQFNRLHLRQTADSSSPAYRHAVVATIAQETRAHLRQLVLSERGDGDNVDNFDSGQVKAYVESLRDLLQATFLVKGVNQAEGIAEPDGLTEEYIARLETMLSQRGIAVPEKTGTRSDAALLTRLGKAWHILRGTA